MLDTVRAEIPSPAPARVSLAWAIAACAGVLAWQWLTVHYNDHGNWTALFQTGQALNIPPQLQSGTYLFPGMGYDGQFYRYVAHDPFFGGGLYRFIDSPTRRYRRILMPALAFFLAAGRQQWIDGSYIAVSALFVLLGAYWLSRWASLHGFHPAWALAFPLIPATLISADRMTVDGALAALTVGAAYFTATRQTTKLYLLLVMACLVRETGPFLLGGCILFELQARRFARSAVWVTAALPALTWYWFVSRNVPGARNLSGIPGLRPPHLSGGIFKAMFRPAHYPLSAGLETITRSLDGLAVCAIVCAVVAAIILLRIRPLTPISIAAFLYAVLALILTNRIYWLDCYSYGRVFSPLLVLVALQAMAVKNRVSARWWMLLPIPLMDLRICLQLGPQALGILRGAFGG